MKNTLHTTLNPSSLISDVQHALNYLYDPVQLEHSPLMHRLGLSAHTNAAAALRQTLIDAVEALHPDRTVPTHTNSARYYHLLYQRYVEQFPQQEVAADLGLSVRQLRRLEKSAITVLAAQLVARFGLHSEMLAEHLEPKAKPMEEIATPSWEEELAWSQKAIPNETVDAAELLTMALKTANPLLRALGLTVEQSIFGHLPSLDVQVIAVRQALLSVLTTLARRAPGGQIAVQASHQAEAVVVRIAVTTAAGEALVLEHGDWDSLKMANELVELSGGGFQLDVSHNETGCVTAELVLPTAVQISVVAVDDNPDTLQLLERYTAGTRYHLIGVREPHQLLSLVEEIRPEIIILDIMLPGIDGWELLGRLRAHPLLSSIPVVVATILPQEQLASALGASAFLRKPIQRRVFLDVLDAQLHALRS